MKKNRENLFQIFGRKISEEEFKNDNSEHIFSDNYMRDKEFFLQRIALNESIKKAKKRKSFVAAACVILLFMPASVFAATEVINNFLIKTQQTNNNAYEYTFEVDDSEATTNSELYHSTIQFKYGYLPEGCKGPTFNGNNQINNFFLDGSNNYDKFIKLSLYSVDKNHKLLFTNVVTTKDFTIGNKAASLIAINPQIETVSPKIYLVYYKDYGYTLRVNAGSAVSDDEIIKIVENIQFVKCKSNEAAYVSAMPSLEVVEKATASPVATTSAAKSAATATTATATTASTTTTNSFMINESSFLSIGDSFPASGYKFSHSDVSDFELTVKDIEIRDTVAGLGTNGFGGMLTALQQLINSDGKLNQELKFVYVTIRIKNTSTTATPNLIQLYPFLTCLNNTNGNLSMQSGDINTTKAILPNGMYIYSDNASIVKDSVQPVQTTDPVLNAYRVQPQVELEYHVGFIVESATTANMILSFSKEGKFSTKSDAEQTIIKLY